jgi:D-3-phosphoglycerate dehydrogenase
MSVGKTLRGRVLGLYGYGYGKIGKVVAGYGEALGMQVVWWCSEEGCARACAPRGWQDRSTLA